MSISKTKRGADQRPSSQALDPLAVGLLHSWCHGFAGPPQPTIHSFRRFAWLSWTNGI